AELDEAWPRDRDPLTFAERGGCFDGRGPSEVRQGATFLATSFLRLKQEGWRPSRALFLALTADEEGGNSNGVQWLLANRRELIDAEYCVNTDAGDFETQKGKRLLLGMQTSEKNYADFLIEVKSSGGHTSAPGNEHHTFP